MTVHRLQINGLDYAVTEEGSGEPLLLFHGFPDSARLWRHQIPALVAAGFRVLAPDLRGFGATARPADESAYTLGTVLGDITALLDHFGVARTRLVSHDWGAALGWALAAYLPERVHSHIACSVGHLSALWHAGIAQRRLAWYMLLFMQRGAAEDLLMRDDWQWFRDLFGHHPEMDTWLADLGRPGALTAALNWYRANVGIETWTREGWVLPRVRVPTLGVWSSGDAYLTETQMVSSAQYMDASWDYHRLEGGSHWFMLDRPRDVATLFVDWFARH
ncbi:MAG: alpha/beta hydrolase [Acidobacteria bacterium]|nr:alpha/beta hydrolase [Acidobacteriota bacterium]